MDFLKVLEKRRSVRSFKNKKITKDDILKLLEYAKMAPSAVNLKKYFFYVVENDLMKKQLANASPYEKNKKALDEASIIIIGCTNKKAYLDRLGKKGEEISAIQDITLATYNLWLTAVNMGFSAVWQGAFDEEKVSKILNISNNLSPIAILPIGIANEIPLKKENKNLKTIYQII